MRNCVTVSLRRMTAFIESIRLCNLSSATVGVHWVSTRDDSTWIKSLDHFWDNPNKCCSCTSFLWTLFFILQNVEFEMCEWERHCSTFAALNSRNCYIVHHFHSSHRSFHSASMRYRFLMPASNKIVIDQKTSISYLVSVYSKKFKYKTQMNWSSHR